MAKNKISNSENIVWYPESDFIPYACYIDKQTILTKNGCLLMTFKIPSFISSKSKSDLFTIREVLRKLLAENFKNQDMSFYFNTVRKKDDIIPSGKYSNVFCDTIDKMWNKQNNWYDQFVNEIYITVTLSLNIEDNIFSPVFILQSLTQLGLKAVYTKEIERCHKILKKFSYLILEKMMEYDLKILSIVEKSDGTYYSEHMRFFSLLINLEKQDFPLSFDDISDIIRTKKINYGSDIIEVNNNADKTFASIFTIKFYNDLTLAQLDKMLQLSMEIVVTETATFVDSKYAVSLFEKQRDAISVSEDQDLPFLSGLNDFNADNKGKDTDFCLSQVSIMIINKNKADLLNNIREFYNVLDELGIVAVRENVYLPTIFWSQLPGNYRYLKRLHIVPKSKLASYISLFNFPTGRLKDNYWGNAITIIPTALDTPYFFNFHYQTNGNTLIVGPKSSGKTTIMNFLLSQTTKIKPKILYIDTMRSSEVFINAIGGKYYRISPNIPDNEQFKINPFLFEDLTGSKKFLINFIIDLVDFQDDGFIEMGKKLTQLKSEYDFIPAIIDKILLTPIQDRSFKNIIEMFNTNDTTFIYSKLKNWYDNNNLSFMFNHSENTVIKDDIVGISLKTIVKNKELTIPVVRYLLFLVNKIAGDEPFILVIDDAWNVIDNDSIASIFFKRLNDYQQKNIITILTTNGETDLNKSYIISSISNFFTTKIYLPTPKASFYERKILDLQDEEARILSLMQVEKRNFLLKNGRDIIISSINLDKFSYYKNIFTCDNVSINAMNKAKQISQSSDPAVWIPIFLKIMEEYEKIVQAKKNKENEINQQKWEKSRNFDNNENTIINPNNK